MTKWINVSTSSNWFGTPVGIVRVEASLAEHFGSDWQRFTISNHTVVESFSSQTANLTESKTQIQTSSSNGVSKVDNYIVSLRMVPKSERLLRTLAFMYSILEDFASKFISETSIRKARRVSLKLGLFLKNLKTKKRLKNKNEGQEKKIKHPFKDGDVILTCGLDWDNDTFAVISSVKKQNQKIQVISYVYDLIAVDHPEVVSSASHSHHLFKHFVLLALNSDLVICISEDVKTEFLAFCERLRITPPKVEVIYLAAFTSRKTKVLPDSTKLGEILNRKYFLSIGTIEPRKNYQTLINSLKLTQESDFLLVIAGKQGWNSEGLIHELKSSRELKGRVIWLESPTDDEIVTLIENCYSYISASSAEGFNLPALEAASMSKHLILSDIPVHRELFPNSIFVPAFDTSMWSMAMNVIRESDTMSEYTVFPRNWSEYSQIVLDLINRELLH